jgi:hypothetical protein
VLVPTGLGIHTCEHVLLFHGHGLRLCRTAGTSAHSVVVGSYDHGSCLQHTALVNAHNCHHDMTGAEVGLQTSQHSHHKALCPSEES